MSEKATFQPSAYHDILVVGIVMGLLILAFWAMNNGYLVVTTGMMAISAAMMFVMLVAVGYLILRRP